MKKLWLVTGATGHVGTILVSVLQQRGEHVRALVRPNSNIVAHSNVEIYEGDIRNRESLIPFFDRGDYDYVSLVHCAALITIASKHNPEVWNINVHGTNNVMSLARDTGVDRIVYVSSVHAIPERPANEIITEVSSFSPSSANCFGLRESRIECEHCPSFRNHWPWGYSVTESYDSYHSSYFGWENICRIARRIRFC